MFLPTDLMLYIVSFCDYKTIIILSKTTKKSNTICKQHSLWVNIGKRDHPLLQIQNKNEYFYKNPMFIFNDQIETYINESEWAQLWINKQKTNQNGVLEHRYPGYVRSIIKTMIQVEKWKQLKNKNRNTCEDWKIAVNLIIDDLLSKSEEENKEMKSL